MKFETKTHTLKYPVTVDVTEDDETIVDVEIKKVVVSAPKGRQMRSIARFANRSEAASDDYTDADMLLDCLEAMSDLPPGAVDELHTADIADLGAVIAPFLEEALGGAQPSSENSQNGSSETEPK